MRTEGISGRWNSLFITVQASWISDAAPSEAPSNLVVQNLSYIGGVVADALEFLATNNR